ncbi:MAG TPA: DUF5107 domain-containing protein, partial [Bryobacteraceae bacterium]|nr:DUF5107 domain-containing protein [Bryobacteraceae bacterium]
ANIGYRGAWAAFGIEFNFPVSHNWVSMSPVPFSYARYPDGSSAYIRVGNIDRVYGMEWTVELHLKSGSTVLEERVTLNNHSDVRHRYYWWNNAGIEVKDDSQICYPMRYTAGHGFSDIDTWPVDSSGKDRSIIRNQTDGPVSRFVYGSREPFMGVWRPDTNAGTVHYAEYAELPAKKIWSWGVDADGLDWRRVLSDNNSAYVEVQGGLYRNQETYAFLEPRQTIHFTEYWMPARGIGGISRANLAGVLNLDRRDGTLVAAFNANRKMAAAARILQGERVIAGEKINLTPERTWTREVKPAGSAPYTFELRDNAGKLLLRHTEGVYDWTPASEVHVGPQPHTVETDPLKRGTEQELQGDLLGALRTYTSADPPLRMPAGRLCASLQRYAEAIRYLEPVAATDPEATYYLGLAYDGAGDQAKARQAYESAARTPAWRKAASLKLGELLARLGERELALNVLGAAQGDLRAAGELIELRKAMGLPIVLIDGGNPPAMPVPDADPERVLDTAAEYMQLGLYKLALDLLSRDFPAVPADQMEPGAVLPQQHPMVAYYRGYCRAKLGESAVADYAAASKLAPLYVFPSRAQDLEVLRAASSADPGDMTARYLLGTQYFARGLTDEALTEWNAARQAKARIPVLHADLGRALLRVRHDSIGALQAFREGLSIDPRNVKLYEGVDESLSLMGRPAREMAVSLEQYPDLAHMPAELVYALALDRTEAQEFDGALALFRDRFFPREEGGTNVRQVWVEVNMMRALAQAAAGQCDAAVAAIERMGNEVPGLAFTRDGLQPFVGAPRTQYLFGQVDARCGHEARATERWRRVAPATGTANLVWAWGAARKLDGYDKAEWVKRFEAALARSEDGSPYLVGVLEALLGKRNAAWAHFQQAILLPDRSMSHHLSRIAMAGTGLPQ